MPVPAAAGRRLTRISAASAVLPTCSGRLEAVPLRRLKPQPRATMRQRRQDSASDSAQLPWARQRTGRIQRGSESLRSERRFERATSKTAKDVHKRQDKIDTRVRAAGTPKVASQSIVSVAGHVSPQTREQRQTAVHHRGKNDSKDSREHSRFSRHRFLHQNLAGRRERRGTFAEFSLHFEDAWSAVFVHAGHGLKAHSMIVAPRSRAFIIQAPARV